jgi:hypothetical protein
MRTFIVTRSVLHPVTKQSAAPEKGVRSFRCSRDYTGK